MALYPRRVTSTATTITVAVSDGTIWTYQNSDPLIAAKGISPAQYKGDQTFTKLQEVSNAIFQSNGGAGGWRALDEAFNVNTKLTSVYMTSGELDAIAPIPALRQKSRTGTAGNRGDVNAWQGAAFNGYGFWYMPAGGHFVHHRNDLYMLRVADPVGVFRIHDTSPLAGAQVRPGGVATRGLPVNTLEDPQYWGLYDPQGGGLRGISLWGPQSEHHYDGMEWCASAERLVFGGDNPQILVNPGAYGSLYVGQHAISVFNPYASTPRSAWTKTTIGTTHTAGPIGAAFGMVDNGNGTVSFMIAAPSTGINRGTYTINPLTGIITSGVPGAGPLDRNEYHTCFRDPATNKYYEFYRLGASNNPRPSLYVLTGGRALVGSGNLNFYCNSMNYNSDDPAVVIVNSKAYIFGFPAVDLGGGLYGSTANNTTKRINIQMAQVDLNTGVVNYFNDGTYVEFTEAEGDIFPGGGTNGNYGQLGYVPQAGVFVAMVAPMNHAIVFRPPSSWTI